MATQQPHIIVLDDEVFNLTIYRRLFTAAGYEIETTETGEALIEAVSNRMPDLVILDIRMPGMDGYEVCRHLRDMEFGRDLPILVVSALDTKESRSLAFAAGANEYMVKPVLDQSLIRKVKSCLRRDFQPMQHSHKLPRKAQPGTTKDFPNFKSWVADILNLDTKKRDKLMQSSLKTIYQDAVGIGISEHQLAVAMSEYTEAPYLPYLEPQFIDYGDISPNFCYANQIAPMRSPEHGNTLVLCNPFDLRLRDLLQQCVPDYVERTICITKPESLHILFVGEQQGIDDTPVVSVREQDQVRRGNTIIGDTKEDLNDMPIPKISHSLIAAAILEKASDIHIEPQQESTLVRFRIDGDLHGRFVLHSESGKMLVTRFKVLAGMDIAEQRRPQDGSFTFMFKNKEYRLRAVTSLTSYGEGLTMRLLAIDGTHPKPRELGMTARQADELVSISEQRSGLILIVGPTGSGKTTTAYSFLHSIDCNSRNVITVEDPIEYRMPMIMQQQINEKIGVTFESLLRTSVRQDPDVLFLGEIRDAESARIAVDFASTGRLTVATLHTTDAASAIFRLERLGITRDDIAASLSCIIAQQLIQRLCPACRDVGPTSPEERAWLSGCNIDIPEEVARPVGCPKCHNRGHLGREGIFEIMRFTPEMLRMVRDDKPIPQIRQLAVDSGSWLFDQHAVQKVGALSISPAGAYLQFLKKA